MQEDYKENYKEHKKYICGLLGLVIKRLRQSKTKSISRISDEFSIPKSGWADIERGDADLQFTSLWRIAEALEMPLSDLISRLEKELPENWSFVDK